MTRWKVARGIRRFACGPRGLTEPPLQVGRGDAERRSGEVGLKV